MQTLYPFPHPLQLEILEEQQSPSSQGRLSGRPWSPVPHAQASALPTADPGPALGGFALYAVARNPWFSGGVFSQAACLDGDLPQSHPALALSQD